MKKNRSKIILISIVIILAAVAVWFFAILDTEKQQDIIEQTQNLFPFGEINKNSNSNEGGQQNTRDDGSGNQDTEEEPSEEVVSSGPRLRKISDQKIGGFVPIVRIEEKEVDDLIVDADGNSIQTTKTIEVENHYVRYSDIPDGNIYESFIQPDLITEKLLTKNIIPNAERVFFSADGSRAVFQYWNKNESTIESYLGRIEKEDLDIETCPFELNTSISLGDDNDAVFQIHQFLNRNPQTRIAASGLNSPGNEGSYADEATITAIKNFQSLHGLEIDGIPGRGTRAKMQEVCAEQQKTLAEAEFAKKETSHTISGFFLAQDIISVAVDPRGDEFFYIQKTGNGVEGVLRKFSDDTERTIFQSPFSEWTSLWTSDGKVELMTKPSYQSNGYSYELDTATGMFHKSVEEAMGLMTLPNTSQTKILVFESSDSVRLSIYDRENNTTTSLSLQTFPEKCVWANDNIKIYCAVPDTLSYGSQYPDTWYQGLETYNDSLWEVNSETGELTLISDLSNEYDVEIDIAGITTDRKNEYLYFKDKISEELWSYRLAL